MQININAGNLDNYANMDLGLSDWLTIDQQRINAFADATLDQQFIHVDEELAKDGPFGGIIAHGFLSLSLLPYFSRTMGVEIEGAETRINYGFEKIRFLQPVKVGSRIRSKETLLDIQPKGTNRFLLRRQITIEIEGEEKPALVAEWLLMVITAAA